MEIVFLVNKPHEIDASYLMQISHAQCWALMHQQCGINDLPMQCAFSSAINIDHTWRKSPLKETITPTFEDKILGRELDFKTSLEKITNNLRGNLQ